MQKASKTNKYIESLQNCRQKIDKIDENILKLLKERMDIVNKVKEIKEENQDKFFIRSAREADMIRDLLKKADNSIPKSTITSIWRKIITSSNNHEQNINISVHNPEKTSDYSYILQQYYADFIPINNRENASEVVLDLEKNKAQIAAFRLPDQNFDSNWWINIPNDLKIFAKIPIFSAKNAINLVVLAKKPLEKSQKDKTLLVIETNAEISSDKLLQTLKNHNLEAKILKNSKNSNIKNINFNLIELEGFFDEENNAIKELKNDKIKPFIKILGVYPDLA